MSQIQNKVMSPEDKKRIAENRQLYERLFRVREELKIKYTASGRVPPICTDQALLDIARNKPLRAEDFALLPGVGKTFAEKYAKYFIPILMEFKSRNVQVADSNPKIKATLSKLEDRLVNINRRNKMLYMPKLHSRQTFDLYSRELITEKFMDFLMRGKPRALKVVDIKPMNDSLENLDAEQQRYVRLTNIVREINKDFRESGNYDAYIAYPFVEGKIIGEDFPVRAPLALFPVQIKVENNFVAVELDRDKDVLYNTNLILLQNKFNKVSRDVPSPVVGDINYQTFISDLVQFYKENGIEIMLNLFETEEYKKQKEELLKLEELKSKDLSFFSYEAGNFDDFLKMHRPKQEEQLENIKEDKVTIDRFTEYTASNFPKYLNGEFFIRHNAVLGQFSLHSTAMQRDFKKIMDSDSLNVLVSELLENYDEIDLYADEDAEIAQIDENIPVKESQINYINNLNASQEQVIVKIQNTDKLVIQGPPGTGKSQSITSLISDFSSKGKTILMVSQKKAALEVIHSRLGHLNKYTVFISDVKDKNSFYEQMMRLTAEATFNQTPESSTGEIADFIEKRIDRLNRISEVLFENRKEGVPMYRLYQENTANQLKCKENDNLAKFLPMAARVVSEELRGRKYTDMLTSFNLINNERILQKVKEYLDIKKTDAWVTTIRPNMSRMEQVNFSNDAAEFIKNQEEFLSKNIFARMFTSGKTKKELKEMFKKYFTERTYFKELFKNPYKLGKKKERGMLTDKEGLVGMELYNKYSFLKTELVNLTENEFTFAAAAINLSERMKVVGVAPESDPKITDALRLVFDFVVWYKIDSFESSMHMEFRDVENFKKITSEVLKLIDEKKARTVADVRRELEKRYNTNIKNSKRFQEIDRCIQSKRRQSVNRFIERFWFELSRGVKVWLMTPEVVAELLPFEKGMFDLVIFDEASQLYVERGLPSISRGKKVVIAGDHKQLRPSSLGSGRVDETENEFEVDNDDEEPTKTTAANAALEEESLLDLARFKYPQTMLNYHYRSRYEELIEFSNHAFYKGKLLVSPNVEEPKVAPIEVIKVDGVWIKRRNMIEAKRVVELIKELRTERKHKETIGVITFNVNQRDLIMDLIDAECRRNKEFDVWYKEEINRKHNGEDIGLFIKNIENVQGDERDIIIFSTAYAKDENGRQNRNFGWLNQKGGENRLNVAITRSKRKVYIITSIEPREFRVEDLSSVGPGLFKKYLEYGFAITNGDKEKAKEILKSMTDKVAVQTAPKSIDLLAAEVVAELKKAGLTVKEQIGIGAHRIDIGIVNEDETGYDLGIEIDSKLYGGSINTRERDIHRGAYLESRGWKIYRLWSTSWWHNKEQEIKKILAMLPPKKPKQEIVEESVGVDF